MSDTRFVQARALSHAVVGPGSRWRFQVASGASPFGSAASAGSVRWRTPWTAAFNLAVEAIAQAGFQLEKAEKPKSRNAKAGVEIVTTEQPFHDMLACKEAVHKCTTGFQLTETQRSALCRDRHQCPGVPVACLPA